MSQIFQATKPDGTKVIVLKAPKTPSMENPGDKFFEASHTTKQTKLFLLLATYLLFTYSVMPDVQTSLVAIQTGVNRQEIAGLWAVSAFGAGMFLYALYRVGEMPG